jgi:hypothetical protein
MVLDRMRIKRVGRSIYDKLFNRIFISVFSILILLGLSQENARGQSTGWSTPINFSQQPDTYSSGPSILCDRYQNLHAFWGERLDTTGAPKSDLFYKNDAGGAWSQPVDVLVTTRFEEVHAAITPDNLVHLVWTNTDLETTYIHAPLSAATEIRAWAKPVVLENNSSDSNIFVDYAGIIYVIYTTADADALAHGIYYISSPDSGKTWSLSKTILELGTSVASTVTAQLAVDGKGRFHVVYTVRSYTYGEYSFIGYLRSIDAGEHWYFPLTFPESTSFQGVAKIAVYTFNDDEIHLTYDLPARIHQWSFDGGDTWSQPIPIVNGVELGAAFGGFNQLVKDNSGVMHVVFAESRGVFHSTWSGLDWSTAELIDTPAFDPHGQTIAICQGNRLSVLYSGNDVLSEVWYSEKILDIPVIQQFPIPTIARTPTLTPTPIENMDISETPIPTKPAINPPILQQQQSLLTVIILPVVSVILLICAVFFIKIKRS